MVASFHRGTGTECYAPPDCQPRPKRVETVVLDHSIVDGVDSSVQPPESLAWNRIVAQISGKQVKRSHLNPRGFSPEAKLIGDVELIAAEPFTAICSIMREDCLSDGDIAGRIASCDFCTFKTIAPRSEMRSSCWGPLVQPGPYLAAHCRQGDCDRKRAG